MTTQATFSAATCVLKNSSSAATCRPGRRMSPVLVREGKPVDLRGERSEPELVGPNLARHAHRQQRAPVEGVLEHDDGLAPGGVAGDLDRVFQGLGAAVGEQRLLRGAPRRDRVEFLGQGDVALVRGHAEAGVGEPLELGDGRPDDLGVGVAGVERTDPSGEVDEDVSVHVGDEGPPSARGVDRRRVADALGNGYGPPGPELLGAGSGKGGLQANRSHDLKHQEGALSLPCGPRGRHLVGAEMRGSSLGSELCGGIVPRSSPGRFHGRSRPGRRGCRAAPRGGSGARARPRALGPGALLRLRDPHDRHPRVGRLHGRRLVLLVGHHDGRLLHPLRPHDRRAGRGLAGGGRRLRLGAGGLRARAGARPRPGSTGSTTPTGSRPSTSSSPGPSTPSS